MSIQKMHTRHDRGGTCPDGSGWDPCEHADGTLGVCACEPCADCGIVSHHDVMRQCGHCGDWYHDSIGSGVLLDAGMIKRACAGTTYSERHDDHLCDRCRRDLR